MISRSLVRIFLNDLTADTSGTVYVSDSGANAVYQTYPEWHCGDSDFLPAVSRDQWSGGMGEHGLCYLWNGIFAIEGWRVAGSFHRSPGFTGWISLSGQGKYTCFQLVCAKLCTRLVLMAVLLRSSVMYRDLQTLVLILNGDMF